MPCFVRAHVPGGVFFFTLVAYGRRPIFQWSTARRLLREAIRQVQKERPFEILATVLLPEHLHCLWRLPEDDADFSTRWRQIKETFTDAYLAAGGTEAPVTPAQARKRMRGVWQPRFWEHNIREEQDYVQHVNYIHFNPVKHGLAGCAHAWPWSSFHQWLRRGMYELNWCCCCKSGGVQLPDFSRVREEDVE